MIYLILDLGDVLFTIFYVTLSFCPKMIISGGGSVMDFQAQMPWESKGYNIQLGFILNKPLWKSGSCSWIIWVPLLQVGTDLWPETDGGGSPSIYFLNIESREF